MSFTRPFTNRRRVLAAVVALLVVIALVIWAVLGFSGEDAPSASNTTNSSEGSSSSDTSDSAKPSEKKPKKDGKREDEDDPSVVPGPVEGTGSFNMDGPAPVQGATFDSMPYALPLNPAGPQNTMVRWVDGWGVSPKDAEKGTMYILGHAWGAAPLVFNPLSEAVTADVNLNAPPKNVNGTDGKPVKRYSSDVLNGARIKMRDGANHQRTWKVTRSWLVDKNEAIVDPDIMDDKRPGRIVLIACSVSGSNDLGYNVIVEGELV
ncbi:sortase [Corynebacterium sp. HMSC08A12]|uniref:sortase n=1 Tax=Corynebacterium sp. HMSC08A12 TaxID=1581134 RepID=UPI0008A58B58|nr:sortase [Corynebacterium sp. HMSC08A12]OFT33031.1 sortase [Corynebacterium sp. HMSC08A12]